MPHFWRMTSFWAKNDVILTIFRYFDKLLDILTTLTWIVPIKTMIEVAQLDKWNIILKMFVISCPIYDIMTSFWATNDAILTIFHYFDQLLSILTTLTWFVHIKTMNEIVQHG